jgi:hypothetical protein
VRPSRIPTDVYGVSCSGDESNRRADTEFVDQVNAIRVVDHLLRFDQDTPALVIGVGDLLLAARTAGFTLNLEKLQLVEPKVAWVGYGIQHGGVTVDPDVEAANSDVTAYARHAIITLTASIPSNENVDLPAMDESAVPPHLPDPLVYEFRFKVMAVIIGLTVIIPR